MRIKGFVLFIVSLILLAILFPIGFVYGIVMGPERDKWFHDMAYSIDQFGNVLLGPLMNKALITLESNHKFGHPDETISSVLGKNKLNNTLTKSGKAITQVLHLFDYNHVEKAIEWVRQKTFFLKK